MLAAFSGPIFGRVKDDRQSIAGAGEQPVTPEDALEAEPSVPDFGSAEAFEGEHVDTLDDLAALERFEPAEESVLDDLEGAIEGSVPSAIGPPLLPFVNGEPTGGRGQELPCLDPTTGEPFARVACASAPEIDHAVETAKLASALWRGTSFEERRRRLHALADVVREQADGIAELIAIESGKPVVEAHRLEVLPALDHLRYLAEHAREAFTGEPVHPTRPMYSHKQAHYLYEPMGIVAVVTPFTMPFALPLAQVAAALAMGNAVLLRPSESTPVTALRIGELCAQAGFPPGVLSVLPTVRSDALYLVSHAGVDKVFLTGTAETGQQVMATAGCVPKPVVLSLGAKHPSIVAADADLDRAARGIVWGAMAHSGQQCGSIERVFVEQPVAQRLIERLEREIDRIRVGNPREVGTDVGPLISAEHRAQVHRQVTQAIALGAKLLRGGDVPQGPGFFYPPTLLLGPAFDAKILRDETLGPVLPLVVVDSLERGVMLANEGEYSHSASGWTTSSATAERLMATLQAGTVTINDVLYTFGEPAATKTGYRASGLGNNHGIAGLREMCRRRFVSYDHLQAEAPLHAFPYDEDAARTTRALLVRLHGRRRFARLAALARLLFRGRLRRRVPRRFFLQRSRS